MQSFVFKFAIFCYSPYIINAIVCINVWKYTFCVKGKVPLTKNKLDDKGINSLMSSN